MPLFCVSITLINDSHYKLNAQIIDATGRHLALIHLIPGQMYIYDVIQGSFQPNTNQPYTPLTVIFLCQSATPYNYSPSYKKKDDNLIPNKDSYVEQFGIWTNVPTGALVNALGSPAGSKSCISRKNPKKKVKKKSSASSSMGSNTWSNDGGQSWQNDAGASWFDCPQDGSDCQKNPKVKSTEKDNPDDFTNYDQDSVQNAAGEQWVKNKKKKKSDSKDKKEEAAPVSKMNKATPLPFFKRN